MSGKLPGLRTAIITYILIVVLALGGAAAHALWSQSGTVTVNVTAGTWAPDPPKPGTVVFSSLTCDKLGNKGSSTDVFVEWTGVEADNYHLTVEGIDPGSSKSQTVDKTGVGQKVSTTVNFVWPSGNSNGKGTYTMTITPKVGTVAGGITEVAVELIGRSQGVICD